MEEKRMEEKRKFGKGLSIILGIFLLLLGLFFLAGNFSIMPGVGFWLSIPAIVCAIVLFYRARRIGSAQSS